MFCSPPIGDHFLLTLLPPSFLLLFHSVSDSFFLTMFRMFVV